MNITAYLLKILVSVQYLGQKILQKGINYIDNLKRSCKLKNFVDKISWVFLPFYGYFSRWHKMHKICHLNTFKYNNMHTVVQQISGIFHLAKLKHSIHWSTTPFIPCPQALAIFILLKSLTTLGTSYKCNHATPILFVTSILHLA